MGHASWMCCWCRIEASDLPHLHAAVAQWSVALRSLLHGEEDRATESLETYSSKEDHYRDRAAGIDPVFAQPSPTPDPTNFRDPVTDQKLKGGRDGRSIPGAARWSGRAGAAVRGHAGFAGTRARRSDPEGRPRSSSTRWAIRAARKGLRRSRRWRTRWWRIYGGQCCRRALVFLSSRRRGL